MNTHQKGYLGEAHVKLFAISMGWNVSVPEIEARYDFILDNGSKLYRAQVKYVNCYVGDAVCVDLRKECRNNGISKVYSKYEVDVLILYSPKTGKCYWIPVELFDGRRSLSFRFGPAKNNQRKNTRRLEDFIWVGSSIG